MLQKKKQREQEREKNPPPSSPSFPPPAPKNPDKEGKSWFDKLKDKVKETLSDLSDQEGQKTHGGGVMPKKMNLLRNIKIDMILKILNSESLPESRLGSRRYHLLLVDIIRMPKRVYLIQEQINGVRSKSSLHILDQYSQEIRSIPMLLI